MKKILISDPVDRQCESILADAGYKVDFKTGLNPDELKSIISEYNGLIVRSETKVNADLISVMDKMEVIGRAGTGVDNIDIAVATRKGIVVMNTPGGNTISTSEHTMALMLSMFRNIPRANLSLINGKWERKDFKGTELHGKTIGIIGLGKIGREVAIRSKAFGMKVIGFDPVLSEEVANKLGITLISLDSIFSQSDVITVHVPLTDETKYIINSRSLGKCKDGVRIINCARGGIVEEEALIAALESGKVVSAAFDVYENEPPDFSGKLIQHPKVVCTPHLGASTEEAQVKVAIQIAEQIIDLFKNKSISGAVNASALVSIENKELKSYIILAENLGCLHAQLINGQLKQVNLNYSGELLHAYTNLLSTAIMKGFLSKMLTETINFVNAPFFSKEMGIVINETKTGANTDYRNLMTIEFITDKDKLSLAGTVFGNNEIRLVSLNEYHLELKPEGIMLIYSNIDKPGILAAVGKILADKNINIAGLSLGRVGIGGKALTIVSLDSEIDINILNKISEIGGIEYASVVKI